MQSIEYRALETMVCSLLMSLVHRKMIEPKDYLTRLGLNELLAEQRGDLLTPDLIEQHRKRVEKLTGG